MEVGDYASRKFLKNQRWNLNTLLQNALRVQNFYTKYLAFLKIFGGRTPEPHGRDTTVAKLLKLKTTSLLAAAANGGASGD